MSPDDFWERPDVVERFAAREPDHRLRAMAEEVGRPADFRVLDVGCAGGRNTVFLAERGFDVWALDASVPMVEETRRRLEPILGRDAARERVRAGGMDDLSFVPTGSVDLVVGLGVWQNARSVAEWDRAMAETARVLAPGGRCLVAHFTPDVDLTGEGVTPVEGAPHLYRGMPGGRPAVLLYADELDDAMARHGLVPAAPGETVVVPTETGRRSTVNGLYVRRRQGP